MYYHSLFSTFSLERKSRAKSSRQIQLLRWICRASAQAIVIKLQFLYDSLLALIVLNTAGANIAPLRL